MELTDIQVRETALNPTQSFIVQAPAGSGKTTLLVERYLSLLRHTQKPASLLAITFSRKAADEMRERIEQALNPEEYSAASASCLSAAFDHRLPQDYSIPHLRIMTIDAFCAQLISMQQHSILKTDTTEIPSHPSSTHISVPQHITEHPNSLYIKAVQDFFQKIHSENPWSASLDILLRHLDNHYPRLERLFVDLLSKRDQWLPYLIHNTDKLSLKNYLEETLHHIVQEALYQTEHAFPDWLKPQINNLLKKASQHLPAKLPTTSALCSYTHFPSSTLSDYAHWCALAEWLLTQSGDWRRKVNHNLGFPAPSSAKNLEDKALYTQQKKAMQDLLGSLSSEERFTPLRYHLHRLRQLPALYYAPAQWEILEALLCLLPALAAQLNLIFQEENTADFIAINLAAMEALGPMDSPSDLALQLERHIQHILIDEFQDISISQHRFIEQLIRGWQPDDGHTLFLVGDPMQSIYRFRQAEVRLFQQVKECGIGGIPLKALLLKNNFRSSPRIIDWVNAQFQTLFPSAKNQDANNGTALSAMPYHPSKAASTKNSSIAPAVFCYAPYNFQHAHLHQHRSHQNTETALLDALKTIGNTGSIGLLVRARSHLADIIPLLNAHQIPFHGVDLNPLMDFSAIRDLWALTCALAHLADTTAWLAVLHGPYGGLSLADLACLMKDFTPEKETLWDRLTQWQSYPLRPAAQQRCSWVLPILIAAWNTRRSMPLATWIYQTWIQLGGFDTVTSDATAAAITQYFSLLSEQDSRGDRPLNIEGFKKILHQTYCKLAPEPLPRLQLLTIHKSKGLEFDHVIIPALERSLPSDPQRLLLWSEIALDRDRRRLLLAPIASAFDPPDATYQYLRQQAMQEDQQERKRLLYVATTRARKTLHLLAPQAPKKPHLNSLLALLQNF